MTSSLSTVLMAVIIATSGAAMALMIFRDALLGRRRSRTCRHCGGQLRWWNRDRFVDWHATCVRRVIREAKAAIRANREKQGR